MATIKSYPTPDRTLKADDALLGDAGGTVQIPVGLLSDTLLATLTAAMPTLVATLLPTAIDALLASLPDESNGDAIPSSGPYLSAGVLKFA